MHVSVSIVVDCRCLQVGDSQLELYVCPSCRSGAGQDVVLLLHCLEGRLRSSKPRRPCNAFGAFAAEQLAAGPGADIAQLSLQTWLAWQQLTGEQQQEYEESAAAAAAEYQTQRQAYDGLLEQ